MNGKNLKKNNNEPDSDSIWFFMRDFMFLWDAKQYGKYEMERTLPCYDLNQSLPKMNYQWKMECVLK